MILSRADIKKAVEKEEIKFDPPLEQEQWGEASVDLRLGRSFTKIKENTGMTVSVADGLKAIGESGLWLTEDYQERNGLGKIKQYRLEEGEFVLALTLEKITLPNHLIARIEGRSTYARMGLSVHQTAPWIQPGWSGPIVLEIHNSGPLNIFLTPGVDKPCQLTFFELKTPLEVGQAYGSRPGDSYQDQDHPLRQKSK